MNLNGKPQVMVVDDDLAMCNFLRSFLSERGYQAVTMGNAEEAVKRYHSERPAAVILDVVMPGDMDGLAVRGTETTRAIVPPPPARRKRRPRNRTGRFRRRAGVRSAPG